jgi:hypothetical protein
MKKYLASNDFELKRIPENNEITDSCKLDSSVTIGEAGKPLRKATRDDKT